MKIKSSTASSVEYAARTEVLSISFRNKQTAHYSGVPQKVFDELVAAPSFGSYMRTHIIGKYNHHV
jgi:hypothetical protein